MMQWIYLEECASEMGRVLLLREAACMHCVYLLGGGSDGGGGER